MYDPYGYPPQYPPPVYPPPGQYPAPYPPPAQPYPAPYPPVANYPPQCPPPTNFPPAAFPQPYLPTMGPPPVSGFVPNGTKKALLVGVNYMTNPIAKLNGCINDARFLKFLLISKFGFSEQNMIILTDDSMDMTRRPTKANLLMAMGWLVQGVKPGDSLFFSFSGHGAQINDLNGDEIDGKDETILPEDYKTAGPIVDDDMHRMLAMAIPFGARLTCVMDCCHSGTGMDLPFVYTRGRVDCEPNQQQKTTIGECFLFSGCMDNQTAADSNVSKVAYSGVLTYSFCKSIESLYPNLSFGSLIQSMQQFSMERGFKQSIQMSSGRTMDLNMAFTI